MCSLFAVSSWFVQRASLTVNIDLSDVTNRYYKVLYRTVVVYEKKNRSWCSVDPEKSQPLGPPFSGKLGKPRFPLERWALGLGFFCPHWTPMIDSIYLINPLQPVGKIKRTVVRWQYAGRTRMRDVFKMFKWCHHVASQWIQYFLEAFSMCFQYKMLYIVVNKKKETIIHVRMG